MKYCDFTAGAPADHLACDEALLDLCEAGAERAILRVWEPAAPFVVLGYANRIAEHVDVEACRRLRIPILRRTSGGGTVLQGPGCLNYALAVRHAGQGPFAGLHAAMAHVLERHRAMVERLTGRAVEAAGVSDLAIDGRKVSGNSQRRKRRAALVHGTFLLSFDLSLIDAVLPLPARQPAYRERRAHRDFLTNLHVPAASLTDALRRCWQAEEPLQAIPRERIRELAERRYADPAWTRRS